MALLSSSLIEKPCLSSSVENAPSSTMNGYFFKMSSIIIAPLSKAASRPGSEVFSALWAQRDAADAAGCVEGLCKKVLRFDRPLGRRVLKFDGPFWPESCGIALTGDKFCMPPKAAGLSLLRSRILFSDVCRLIV